MSDRNSRYAETKKDHSPHRKRGNRRCDWKHSAPDERDLDGRRSSVESAYSALTESSGAISGDGFRGKSAAISWSSRNGPPGSQLLGTPGIGLEENAACFSYSHRCVLSVSSLLLQFGPTSQWDDYPASDHFD